jgi:hypothetical protein
MILQKIIQVILLICLLAILAVLATGIFLGSAGVINALKKALPGSSGSDRFDALVTPEKITYLLWYLAGLLVLLSVLLHMVSRRFDDIRAFIRETGVQCSRTWGVLKSPPTALILLIPAAAAVYYAAVVPVSQDEALTYLFFTSRNALVAYTYYPFPNNHILHSVLTTLTKHLPFPVLFNLRIPSILVQMATWLLALRMLSRLYDRKYAILAVSLASMLFLNIYYSYQSRGYALVNFTCLASCCCAMAIGMGSRNRWRWHFLALFSAMGFATMPSFLYPFITIHVILLWKIRRITAAQILSGVGTVVLTVFFYAPAIIVNGVSALAGNTYVKPAPRSEVLRELPLFLEQLMSELTAMHWIWVAAILSIALAHLLLLGRKSYRADAVIWMCSVPCFILLHSVIPFPRTFIYMGFLSSMLIASMVFPLLARRPLYGITMMGILLQVLLLVRFQYSIAPYEERDPQINFTAAGIINEIAAPGRSYLCSGALLGTNLLFEIQARGIKGSGVVFEDRPVNADTCTAFDYVIIGHPLDSTSISKPIFQNAYYSVYRAKP